MASLFNPMLSPFLNINLTINSSAQFFLNQSVVDSCLSCQSWTTLMSLRYTSSSSLQLLNSVDRSALRLITGDVYSAHHCILYNKVWSSCLKGRLDTHWYLFNCKALITTSKLIKNNSVLFS